MPATLYEVYLLHMCYADLTVAHYVNSTPQGSLTYIVQQHYLRAIPGFTQDARSDGASIVVAGNYKSFTPRGPETYPRLADPRAICRICVAMHGLWHTTEGDIPDVYGAAWPANRFPVPGFEMWVEVADITDAEGVRTLGPS